MKINKDINKSEEYKMQTLSDIEDINSLEQESPQIVCVWNVWGLTNDYLHAVQGRMEHAKHTLQGLISNTPYLEKASALAKKKKMLCSVTYARVKNWRTGKMEELKIKGGTPAELKNALLKELGQVTAYLALLETLIEADAKAYQEVNYDT